MGNIHETGQAAFWAGEFGDERITRSREKKPIANNLVLITKAVTYARPPLSGIGIGPNTGWISRIVDTTRAHP